VTGVRRRLATLLREHSDRRHLLVSRSRSWRCAPAGIATGFSGTRYSAKSRARSRA